MPEGENNRHTQTDHSGSVQAPSPHRQAAKASVRPASDPLNSGDDIRARSLDIIQTLEDELRGLAMQLDAQQSLSASMQLRQRDLEARLAAADAPASTTHESSEQRISNAIVTLEQQVSQAVAGDLLSRAAIDPETDRLKRLGNAIDAWSGVIRGALPPALQTEVKATAESLQSNALPDSSEMVSLAGVAAAQIAREMAEREIARLRSDRSRLDTELARLEIVERELLSLRKTLARSFWFQLRTGIARLLKRKR